MTSATIQLQLRVDADPHTTFAIITSELAGAWRREALRGGRQPLRWSGRPDDPIVDATTGLVCGEIEDWKPGEAFAVRWSDDTEPAILVRLDAADSAATSVTIELSLGLASAGEFADVGGEGAPGWLGWVAECLAGPAIASASPAGVAEWLYDRRARWPEGERAGRVYSGSDRGPHARMARWVLKALALEPSDRFLEIGCGAGVSLLRWALGSGCRVTGVDHSATMVQLSREHNADAVEAGRLTVTEADATRLPFPDDAFTSIGMVQVFQTLPDRGAVLRECSRVLDGRGRLASISGGGPDEPEQSAEERRHTADELVAVALAAGFTTAEVSSNDYGGMLLTAGNS